MGELQRQERRRRNFLPPELHAVAFADMDGDGIPDVITGKRLFCRIWRVHLDPDTNGAADFLYWYRTVRNPKSGRRRGIRTRAGSYNRSGVGSQFVVKDLNGDGAPDVEMTSGPKGTTLRLLESDASTRAAREVDKRCANFPVTALLLAGAAMLSAQTTRTTWRDYLGGPDMVSRITPALKQIDKSNVNKLELAWTYDTSADPSYTFCPIVIDNIAYFAAKQGALVAVDAATGKELWVHSFESAGGGFGGRGGISAQRGANYWESKDRSDRRIFVSSGGFLQRAIDALPGVS